MRYPLSRQLTYDAYESPFYRSHYRSLTVTPHKLYFGLNLSKTFLYTHAQLVIIIYMSKQYLSICRNPIYFTMSRSQIRFTFTASETGSRYCLLYVYLYIRVLYVYLHIRVYLPSRLFPVALKQVYTTANGCKTLQIYDYIWYHANNMPHVPVYQEKNLKTCLPLLLLRLVGEGLNPEKNNIKAFLVSFDAEWYHE